MAAQPRQQIEEEPPPPSKSRVLLKEDRSFLQPLISSLLCQSNAELLKLTLFPSSSSSPITLVSAIVQQVKIVLTLTTPLSVLSAAMFV